MSVKEMVLSSTFGFFLKQTDCFFVNDRICYESVRYNSLEKTGLSFIRKYFACFEKKHTFAPIKRGLLKHLLT